jgi:hypothetical protein
VSQLLWYHEKRGNTFTKGGRRQGRGEEGGRSSSRGPVRTWQDCAQRSISSSLPKLQDARADDDDLLLFFCTLAAFDWEIISVPFRHKS